jgi:hypothetical protein
MVTTIRMIEWFHTVGLRERERERDEIKLEKRRDMNGMINHD